jgi:predicted PhzF superfamily epimerase YddE/YHI9
VKFYQIDSFADTLFSGNPAGVCLLYDAWLPDDVMQNIAMKNNLSETAFVYCNARGDRAIRWFTPAAEVDLCGHATLAAAHALFVHENVTEKELIFESRRGILKVAYEDDLLVLDFPRDNIHQIEFEDRLDCFQFMPKETWRGTGEYLLVFEEDAQIKNAVCNLEKASKIDLDGFIITAKSKQSGIDFVSRYFSPKFGLNEDPVTGSAHTLLVPYWQGVTGLTSFHARQISKRGGDLFCRAEGSRIKIGGKAITFFAGELFL